MTGIVNRNKNQGGKLERDLAILAFCDRRARDPGRSSWREIPVQTSQTSQTCNLGAVLYGDVSYGSLDYLRKRGLYIHG